MTVSIKIDGPGSLRSGSVKRSGRSDGGSSGAFSKMIGEDAASAAGVSTANPVTAVESLWALQEVDDAGARASKGKRRALDLLDSLDDLRHGLLIGSIPREKLASLSRMIQTRRAQVDDPKLAALLDEVDLRAQVELAKFHG
jgi:hypothetical protein